MADWKHTREAIAVLLALGLYALGATFVLLPILLYLNIRYIPMPSVFRSWTSRLFGGFLFLAVLLQIAATLQFLIAPQSGFLMIAILLTVLHIGLWAFIPVQKQEHRPFFDSADAGALVVVIFFLLPFAPILLGQDSIVRIADIGGIQAIDATNHFAGIAEMTSAQHFTYTPGYYYPKGFHLATAFIQDTGFSSQYSLGWQGSAWLFFGQYMAMGIMLSYAVYYFGVGLLSSFKQKIERRSTLLLGFCLGPMMAVLYVLSFLIE